MSKLELSIAWRYLRSHRSSRWLSFISMDNSSLLKIGRAHV